MSPVASRYLSGFLKAEKKALKKDEEYRCLPLCTTIPKWQWINVPCNKAAQLFNISSLGNQKTSGTPVQCQLQRVLPLCTGADWELIQDFDFPAAAHRIKATEDGAFIYATGIHPPRVCFRSLHANSKSKMKCCGLNPFFFRVVVSAEPMGQLCHGCLHDIDPCLWHCLGGTLKSNLWLRDAPQSSMETLDGGPANILCQVVNLFQVRCYELSQLSLKFERHLDSEIVDFEVSTLQEKTLPELLPSNNCCDEVDAADCLNVNEA